MGGSASSDAQEESADNETGDQRPSPTMTWGDVSGKASAEQAVEIPVAAGFRVFAVDPEALTVPVFGAIVIAGASMRRPVRMVSRAPPFRCDPFRALDPGDVVQYSAPVELVRCCAGGMDLRFDGFRWAQ